MQEKEDKCIYCDSKEGLEWHHIWPLSLGGPDTTYNMIRVCHEHHAILHDMKNRNNISNLTKEGLDRAKSNGTILGPLIKIAPDVVRQILVDRMSHTLDWCSTKYGVDRMTIQRTVKTFDNDPEDYIRRWEGQAVARQVAALKNTVSVVPSND